MTVRDDARQIAAALWPDATQFLDGPAKVSAHGPAFDDIGRPQTARFYGSVALDGTVWIPEAEAQ